MHDIPVLHHVLLAFDADAAGVAAGFLRSERHVVVVLDAPGAISKFSRLRVGS